MTIKTPSFGYCLFEQQPGKGCGFWIPQPARGAPGECGAEDWDIIKCYLEHYGNKLKPDGGIRILDAMVHLVLANDDEFDTPGPYDLPRDKQFFLKGERSWR